MELVQEALQGLPQELLLHGGNVVEVVVVVVVVWHCARALPPPTSTAKTASSGSDRMTNLPRVPLKTPWGDGTTHLCFEPIPCSSGWRR